MPPPASQPTRASARVTRSPERLRYATQPVVRRRISPPPSPPREEIPVVPQPRAELAVRVEIIGMGEEEEIVEIHEAVAVERGGGDGEVRGEALLNRGARIVRGVERSKERWQIG